MTTTTDETLAPNARGRYTAQEVSPLDPSNQPAPDPKISSFRRCCSCLLGGILGTCRAVLCRLAVPALLLCRRRVVALSFVGCVAAGALAHLASLDRTALKFASEEIRGALGDHGLRLGGSHHPRGSESTAFRQSLGFFDDVPLRRWKKIRSKATEKRRGAENVRSAGFGGSGPFEKGHFASPAEFFEAAHPVEFECPDEERVGGGSGGGGYQWTVCDPSRIAGRVNRWGAVGGDDGGGGGGGGGCLIYTSARSVANDWSFETALRERTEVSASGEGGGGCEIHAFRPGITSDATTTAKVAIPEGVTLHDWGFRGSKVDVPGNFKTIQETMKALGHEGRTVDVLMLDCDGCEFDCYEDLVASVSVFPVCLCVFAFFPSVLSCQMHKKI